MQLTSADQEVSTIAVQKLNQAGAPAVPAIETILREGDDADYYNALQALEGIGDASVPALIRALNEPEENRRHRVFSALARVALPDPEPVIEALRSGDERVAAGAAAVLGSMGREVPSALEPLLRCLEHDERANVRAEVVRALYPVAGKADPILPALFETLLHDPDFIVRGAAAETLGRLQRPSERIYAPLLEAIQQEDKDAVRIRIMWAFTRHFACPASIAHSLFETFRTNPELRSDYNAYFNLSALAVMAMKNETCLDEYIALLHDERSELRASALRGLNGYRESGTDLVRFTAPCMNALDDPSPEVRAAAALLLPRLTPEPSPTRDLLEDRLNDEDFAVRAAAAQSLANLGWGSPKLDPVIRELAASAEPETRFDAVRMLEGAGTDLNRYTWLLLEAMSDSSPQVRQAAARVIGLTEYRHDDLLVPLTRLAFDEDQNVRSTAVWALGVMAPDSPEAKNAVLQCLTETDRGLRSRGFSTLEDVQITVDEVAPLLARMVTNGNPESLSIAASVLRKLRAI